MRRGSVAIVPLLLALMLFFWFIWFLGGENDLLFQINKVENVQHIQEELIVSAMQERLKLEQKNTNWSNGQLDAATNHYVNNMMKINKIQE
ncbi:MAG: hypothetical protein Q8K81_07325 [Sulfuricurvum sp.]|nr:hypothetical protein [Sulfuricurvum sp.]